MAADSDNSATVKKTVLIGLGILAIFVIFATSCGSPGYRECGDYDYENGRYEYDPNDGDYDLRNGEYVYVGCDDGRRSGGSSGSGGSSSSGGVWFFGGSSGSSNRGGGPGWGK